MNGRPIIAPPIAPARQVPVAPPPLPPVLAALVPVDRWRYWRLFCGFGLLLAGAGFGAGFGWSAGAPPWFVLAVAAMLAGPCAAGLGWTHRAYSADLHAERTLRVAQAQAYAAQLAEWQASLDAERAALTRWSEYEHGHPPSAPKPEPTHVTNVAAQEAQAQAARAALVADLTPAIVAAVVAQLQPPAETRARVTPPAAPEDQTTQQLDDPALLLRTAYTNGPTYRLIATAWRNEPITIRAMVTSGGWLTDDDWRKLTDLLEGQGILIRKSASPTAGFALAAAYRLPTEAACHAAVIARLVGCVLPSALPGDLADSGAARASTHSPHTTG